MVESVVQLHTALQSNNKKQKERDMARTGKFHSIKLSYIMNNVTFNHVIQDDFFNDVIETRMRDKKCTMYEALMYSIVKITNVFTDNSWQKIELECIDDMGFKIKIER